MYIYTCTQTYVCLSVCTYLSIYLSNYPRIYIYVGQSSLFGGLRESLPDQPKITSFHPPRKKSSRLPPPPPPPPPPPTLLLPPK